MFRDNPHAIMRITPPFVLAAKNLKHWGVYEDIYELGPAMYAVTNRRFSLADNPNDQLMKLYWAPSLDAILRSVYGQTDKNVSSMGVPPDELLIETGCLTFNRISEYAKIKKLNCSKVFVRAADMPTRPDIGLCLKVDRFEYYFNCSVDDSAEMMHWGDESFAAIGINLRWGITLDGQVNSTGHSGLPPL